MKILFPLLLLALYVCLPLQAAETQPADTKTGGAAQVISLLKGLLVSDPPQPPAQEEKAEKPPVPTTTQDAETAKPQLQPDAKTQDQVASSGFSLDSLHALEIEGNDFNWRRDWWKYSLMLLVGLLSLACCVYLLKALVKLLHAVICVAFGSLGAALAIAFLHPWVLTWLPEQWHWLSKGFCSSLGFLFFYGLSGATIRYLRKPLRTELNKKG